MASIVTPMPVTVRIVCPSCTQPVGGESLDEAALYALVAANPGRLTCGACGESFFLDTADPFHPGEQLTENAAQWSAEQADAASRGGASARPE